MKKKELKTIQINGQEKTLEVKSFQVAKIVFPDVKADGEDAVKEGTFTAYVSVFNNKDAYGDVVMPGAFKDWITNWFPRYPKVVRDHDWTQPIAKILSIEEDDIGLKVTAQLLLEIEKAKETYILMKEGVITDFSFGYSIEEDEWDAVESVRRLKKIAVWEVSPVLVGANRSATLTSVKSVDPKKEEKQDDKDVEVKKGAVLSKKNRSKIEAAIKALNELLESSATEEEGEDEGKNAPADAEDSKTIKVKFV